jgi:hypothetical protein
LKKNRERRKKLYEDATTGRVNIWNDFVENDPDWPIMRSKHPQEFFELYDSAVNCYMQGHWLKAKDLFEKANVK